MSWKDFKSLLVLWSNMNVERSVWGDVALVVNRMIGAGIFRRLNFWTYVQMQDAGYTMLQEVFTIYRI